MDNCDLSKLTVKPGKLVPKFSPAVQEYSVTLPSDVHEVKFAPLTSDSGASYFIKGIEGGGKTLALAEGQMLSVDVEVTAEDGKTTKMYTVTVRRLSADDASLSSLDVSAGWLYPRFSPLKMHYTCHVPCSVDTLTVKAKPEDASMKVSLGSGAPLSSVTLQAGETKIDVSVISSKGTKTVLYTVAVVRNPVAYTRELEEAGPSTRLALSCSLCWNIVHCPIRIKGCKEAFCHGCLMELTRTHKINPLTGEPLPKEDWWEACSELDEALAGAKVSCTLPGGEKVKGSASELGKLVRHGRTAAAVGETTAPCPQCSCVVPLTDKEVHEGLLCAAKHSVELPPHKIEPQSWEKRMRRETGEEKSDILIKEAEDWEKRYLGCVNGSAMQAGDSPADLLTRAMANVAAAIKLFPNVAQYHLKLGLLLEESFYMADIYGVQKEKEEEPEGEEGEDLASEDSKDEEFLAICQLHGVGPGAPLALQLKAVDTEYHALKDAGQTFKAEHVQQLYAWKSKKALQASQGAYAGSSEGPVARAVHKCRDAVKASPSNHTAQYHLGRLLLLTGQPSQALVHLRAALGIKPTHMETRFCLGLALAAEKMYTAQAAILVREGLAAYLAHLSERCETTVEQQKTPPKSLLSDNFWRGTNVLVCRGFLVLAQLGGSGGLTRMTCLLQASHLVWTLPLYHKGSTHKQLLWTWAEARYLLQQRSSEPESLPLCRTFASLLDHMGLEPSPELRDMKLKVCQSRAQYEPWSSEALQQLGAAQLACFEADETRSDLLSWAEQSFRASLACEGKSTARADAPEGLVAQGWWKAAQSEAKGKMAKSESKSEPVKKALPVGGVKTTAVSGPTAKGSNSLGAKRAPPQKAPTKTTAPRSKPTTCHPSAGRGKTTGEAAGPKVGSARSNKGGAVGAGTKLSPAKPVGVKEVVPAAQSTTEVVPSSPPQDSSGSPSPAGSEKGGDVNKKAHHSRLGLARTLLKQTGGKLKEAPEEAIALYREVMSMAPGVHDAYIELGELLARRGDTLAAVEVYSKFPFAEEPSFDDGYLYGEIVHHLMAAERYNDPLLEKSLVALGRVLGITALEKQFAVLESKFQSSLLKKVTAGIHGKEVDDPSLQAYFKFKCWA